jgi:hypothetical protein
MWPSEDFTNANWSGGNYTIVANDLTSPDGTQNADKFTTTSTSVENNMRISNISILANIGSSYTTTIFAKKGTGNFLRIRNLFVTNGGTDGNAWFNLNTGAVGTVQSSQTASIQDMGNGWYRCSLTGVVGLVNSVSFIDFGFTNTDATKFPSSNVNGYVWGAQLEAGSYATSYVPTTTASVTRVADDCVKSSASSIIGQTEGVIYINWDYKNSGSSLGNLPICLDGGSGNEVYFYADTNGNYSCEMYLSNAQQFSFSGSLGSFGTKKIAIAYKQNDFALYVNGVQIGTDNSGSVPAMDRLYIGRFYGNTTSNIASGVSEVLLFKTRLTNAQLAEITTL